MKKAICILTAVLLLAGLAASGKAPAMAEEDTEYFGQLTNSVLDGITIYQEEPDPEEDEDPEEKDPEEDEEETEKEDPEKNGEEPEEDEEEGPEDEDEDTDTVILRTELVASGTQVWRIRDDSVVCEDTARPGDEPVSRSVEDVISEAAEELQLPVNTALDPKFTALVSRDAEGVRICIALRDTAGVIRTILVGLTADPEEIRVCETAEATEALDVFFGKGTSWRQVELTGLGDTIVACGLDKNGIFHVYRYALDTQECRKLAYLPAAQCTALIPCGEKVMIIGPSGETPNELVLTALTPEDGRMTLSGTAGIETDAARAVNIGYNETENMIYYTAGNIAFRVPVSSGNLPVPFASMEEAPVQGRNGVLVGEEYVLCGEDGELLANDTRAELQIARLRIFDATGSETVRETAIACSAGKTEYYVTVSGTETGEAEPAETPDAADGYDVYITAMNEPGYAALKAGGSMTELNVGESVRAAVADMPEYIREDISDGERLLAVPVASACECFIWDVNAFRAVTGVSRGGLPTDWTGFLELLGKTAEEGKLNNSPYYTLYESRVTASEMRELVFSWILRDCLLLAGRDGNDGLPAIMTPVLQAFEKVNWSGLGLPAEKTEEGAEEPSAERTALVSIGGPEIAETSMMDGIEYWPLSMTAGGERLIPQTVSVLWVRSGTAYPEAASDFVNDYWESTDILTKMTLCQSMNEPLADLPEEKEPEEPEETDPEYDEDEDAWTEDEEWDESVTAAEKGPRWIASAQSIADYRGFAGQTVAAAPAFGSAENEKEAARSYLDGKISAEQFINMLVSILQER